MHLCMFLTHHAATCCSAAGILDLLNRNEDMVGTVLGHEAAHALARHSGEKLTLGLAVTGRQ